METVNGYLIVLKKEQPKKDALLLSDKKEKELGVASYEVLFGNDEFAAGITVLLDERDLLPWDENAVIKSENIIARVN